MSQTINLGDIARDTVTGFEGVVIGIIQWLYGCRRISIQPRELKDGKPIEHVSFDEPQVALIQKAAVPSIDSTPTLARTGGPRPEPTRR